MVNVLYSPPWFCGKDILFDLVGFLVLALIGYFCWQYARMGKKKGHVLFAGAFFVLALSFLFKILTNFTLYSKVIKTVRMGFFTFSYPQIYYNDTLFVVGETISHFLLILGMYLLYSFYYKQKWDFSAGITLVLMLLVSYFSFPSYVWVHVMALLLLGMIIYKHYSHCRQTKDHPACLILLSFGTIALSQIFFIFEGTEHWLYVTAECVQLLGYLLLLFSFILVLYYGRKKN